MPSLADRMRESLNGRIADEIGDELAWGSVIVKGFFYRTHRELSFDGGPLSAFELSFDCRYEDINTMAVDETVVVKDNGQDVNFTVRQFLPEDGDETGWVTIVLGTA